MNLLLDVSTLINLEIIGLFLILNTFLSTLLKDKKLNKYIPENKIGKVLNFFIQRILLFGLLLVFFLFILNLFICMYNFI
jgi:hypothetical protein